MRPTERPSSKPTLHEGGRPRGENHSPRVAAPTPINLTALKAALGLVLKQPANLLSNVTAIFLTRVVMPIVYSYIEQFSTWLKRCLA